MIMIEGSKISELIEIQELKGTEYIVVQDFDDNKKIKLDKLATKKDIEEIKNNIDLYAYGVEWDTTVADPHCTRIGNPLLHKSLPIQSSYRGCIVKDGKIQYYLNPNDWSKKEDGTPSKLDGTDGDVYVHILKHYGKSWSIGTKRRVMESFVKIDNSWFEIPEMLVAAYRITVSDNKTRSVVNTDIMFRGGGNRPEYDKYLDTDPARTDLNKPRTLISRGTMRTYAKNANSELLCYDYYKWIFYWNFVIEYATFNSQDAFNSELTSEGYHQGGLGPGVTTWNSNDWQKYNNYRPVTPNGYCNNLGNFTGTKTLTLNADSGIKTFEVPRWRGFDNPFGDIYTNLDGIVLKREAANEDSKVYVTNNPNNFDDSLNNKIVAGIEIAQDGYIKEFDLGDTGNIIPSEVSNGASSTTHKCDYHYCNKEYTRERTLLAGGDVTNGSRAGVDYFCSGFSVGSANGDVGFRTIIRL